MGRDARRRKERHRAETRHRRRLFGGVRTADEVHRELGLRGRCHVCGGPPAIRIRVFAPLDELVRRQPEFVAVVAANNPDAPGVVPTVPMGREGAPFVKLSDLCACDLCRADAERAAARGPSWCVVEIDRGPGADRPLVQVPGVLA